MFFAVTSKKARPPSVFAPQIRASCGAVYIRRLRAGHVHRGIEIGYATPDSLWCDKMAFASACAMSTIAKYFSPHQASSAQPVKLTLGSMFQSRWRRDIVRFSDRLRPDPWLAPHDASCLKNCSTNLAERSPLKRILWLFEMLGGALNDFRAIPRNQKLKGVIDPPPERKWRLVDNEDSPLESVTRFSEPVLFGRDSPKLVPRAREKWIKKRERPGNFCRQRRATKFVDAFQ